MMDLGLRATAPRDLAEVLELERDPDVAPSIKVWPRDRHLRAISDPDEAHLTLTDADGFAGFSLLAGLTDVSAPTELRRIALRRRGAGNGRRALALVLDHAFAAGSPCRVWLDVVPGNDRALRLYQATGFTPDGFSSDTHLLPDGTVSRLRVMSISADSWRGRSDRQSATGALASAQIPERGG